MKLSQIFLSVFLFFLSVSRAKSQEISGYVSYSVFQSTDSVNNAPEELWMLSAYPFIPKIASMMTFKLEFTSTKSLFTLVKSKELEKISNDDLRHAISFVEYKDSTWQDIDYCYNFDRDPRTMVDKKGLIVKTRNNFDWKISTEKKMIGDFTCYKATGNREISFRKDGKQQIRTTPVIAWFCPDIPVPFGPLFSRDLPGLIFELQLGGTLYGLKELNLTNKPDIALLPKKEVITRDQWRDRLYEKAKELNISYQ